MCMAVYSCLLTFGTVPLKLVLLYGKTVVRILIAFYVILDVTMLVSTIITAFVNTNQMGNIFFTLLYQLGLNVPTLILMIPLWFYITETETYL